MRMFPDMRSFSQNYRCYSVSMLPGNERNDVENGGKSLCFEIFALSLSLTNRNRFSHYATISLGSADASQHRISHVVQNHKQKKWSTNTRWRSRVHRRRRQNLHPVLDDAELTAGRRWPGDHWKCLTARRYFLKIPASKRRFPWVSLIFTFLKLFSKAFSIFFTASQTQKLCWKIACETSLVSLPATSWPSITTTKSTSCACWRRNQVELWRSSSVTWTWVRFWRDKIWCKF